MEGTDRFYQPFFIHFYTRMLRIDNRHENTRFSENGPFPKRQSTSQKNSNILQNNVESIFFDDHFCLATFIFEYPEIMFCYKQCEKTYLGENGNPSGVC